MKFLLAAVGIAAMISAPAMAKDGTLTAIDPGPRTGVAHAGGPLGSLTPDELAFFNAGREMFRKSDTVAGGLGPRFNLDSCVGCHSQPAIGGSSPALNPQVAVATKDGMRNVLPAFITASGPVREARFRSDGGVHALFTVAGSSTVPNCQIRQPDFARIQNVVFRIPTPLFGLGLVELISDERLVAAARPGAHFNRNETNFNRSGNDGTTTRFGWKAQNKSLMIFAGEAYNVEQGLTNELFPNERDPEPACSVTRAPEDQTNLAGRTPSSGSPAADYSSDVVNFTGFMRGLAAPTPFPDSPSSARGRAVFNSVGCAGCHVGTQRTSTGREFSPYSDFALHDMGKELADGIVQGEASGSEFRTAPLWGASQRLFFLHDGRTRDLLAAIQAHDGEAKAIIKQFGQLPVSDQQAILDFLRSL